MRGFQEWPKSTKYHRWQCSGRGWRPGVGHNVAQESPGAGRECTTLAQTLAATRFQWLSRLMGGIGRVVGELRGRGFTTLHNFSSLILETRMLKKLLHKTNTTQTPDIRHNKKYKHADKKCNIAHPTPKPNIPTISHPTKVNPT